MNKDEILRAAKWRGAVKEFDPDRKINEDDMEFLLEIARLSPTSYGFEPYSIIIVQNPKLREQLVQSGAVGVNGPRFDASHILIFTVKTDLGVDSKYFREIMSKVRNLDKETQNKILTTFSNFQNNYQDLTDDRKRHDWAAKQAYIVMANIMLAAAQINIDSCAIEGFDKNAVESILNDNKAIDLNVDRVVVILALGYRAKDPAPKTRRSVEEIVKIV